MLKKRAAVKIFFLASQVQSPHLCMTKQSTSYTFLFVEYSERPLTLNFLCTVTVEKWNTLLRPTC